MTAKLQLELFDGGSVKGRKDPDPPVTHTSGFLSPEECLDLWDKLEKLRWTQNYRVVAGRRVPHPRREIAIGPPNLTYSYSGVSLMTVAMPPFIAELRDRIERAIERELAGQRLDLVIGNRYANGSDHIDWHSDDEPIMGKNPVIATLSLGCPRKFHMKRRGAKLISHKYKLMPGSLFVMGKGTQQEWIHSVPAEPHFQVPRISLTFRPLKASKRPDRSA
jgi:alkylated DNA repair dioxygenase AlkB